MAEYETKMAMFEQMQQENQRAQELLTELHANGQIEIDENGNVSPSKQKPQALEWLLSLLDCLIQDIIIV